VKPQSLVLFPNPASNHFTIQTPNIMKDGIVQIVNARGQLVYEKSILNQSEINLDLELSAGCYIIKVNTLTDTYNERLIIR
ncbi:MAG: T9SS type A sorting domain-containing protein, partial [Crocinitomicaceae bacterium]